MRNNRLQKNTTRQIFVRRISKGLADIFHIDHLELIRMHPSTKKSDRRDYPVRRRWKSSIVHDPNGSMSIFKRFCQSGGRDYEGYRRWLRTRPNRSIDNSSKNTDKIFGKINQSESALATVEILYH